MKRALCRAALLSLMFPVVARTAWPAPTPQGGGNPSAISSSPYEARLPFPRLGMWWPDPWNQPLQDIARYDWVILGPWAESFVDPIKALRPEIILLNSTNACELSYDPDPRANPDDNADVLAVPAEWFLTQVGSTLTQPVGEADTVLHVAAMTASDGAQVHELFVQGDTVLIGSESLLVESVDSAAKTLTVTRGYVRPAVAHAAGERIAAHITFWPDSWLLNLSTFCPLAIADPRVGPETWGDYHARTGTDALSHPGWDGIVIDRADPNQSWLVGGSTARTIDPDQSNTLLSDYSAFDEAWNFGLRQYEQDFRQALPGSPIIFTNWGIDNYDHINGNNFEGFPLDDGQSYRGTWNQTVFGTVPDVGSYFTWMERGLQPNLTMVETYEDDDAPPPDDITYKNPCVQPGFIPNYRKMRFGLTTALLNDGFFSYEISTNGHGSLCLLWFDEYDNVGQGRGYLGQPVGHAQRLIDDLVTPNLLSGGDFESQGELDQWGFWTDSGYAGSVSLDPTTAAIGGASARVSITQAQGTSWQAAFTFDPVTIGAGTEYTLSFWAKADHDRLVDTWVQQNMPPWETYLTELSHGLTTDWQHFELTQVSGGQDVLAQFTFGLGQETGTVWIDDVKLREGNVDLWRRDFEGGIALVNATHSPQTVDLETAFRKIAGVQDPIVNDGSRVNQVTLNPLDGLILLRQ